MNTEHSTGAGWRNLLLVLGLLAALARAQVVNTPNLNLSEDTDQDGISDADEVALGLDPYNPYNGISALDGAAFIVAWERYLGASSSTVDTDGDGWSDFDEVMVYQTNLFDERSLPGPASSLPAVTTSQPVAASTPTATPSTSLITNGDFSKTNISTWIDGKKLKGYNGSGFEWAAGSVEGWSAYAGSTIEVWNTGTRVVELNGDKSNYGIQQKVEAAKPGAYLLTWKSLGRTQEAAPAKNKKTPPPPNNLYFVQVQVGEGSGGRAIKTENFTAGGDGVLVFQLSEKDLTDANGKGIYIAFIPTISSNSYGSLISGVNLVLFEFITPAGDPVNAPVDAGTTPTSIPDGANEFTFSTATNGVLTMKLKAKVPGVGSMPAAEQAKFTFEIDTIGSSTFAWDGANPGGKATISGDFITATATYAGLPQNYTDFGLKKARVKHGGNNAGEAKFEVFFPRDAKNHPGIRNVTDPNWFFYWEQLIPGHNLRYRGESSDDSNAEVPAMKSWNYHLTADKTSISIFSSLCGEGRQYDVGKFFSGVDAFLAMVLHELKHVDQIARADILVPTGQAGSPWSNGWSFERPNHNHWTVGADGKPGVAGVDDDGDGKIDNLVQGGPGELGRGDDVDLSHPKAYAQDWPSAWPIPSPLKHKLETEAEAINYADQQHDEHEKARSDWGNPGKNHNTIDKWND